MKSMPCLTKNENGFVLIVSMVIMLALTLIGISAISTSVIEMGIGSNDRRAREAFHGADGGLEAGIEVLEQNLNCPVGFTTNLNLPDGTGSTVIRGVEVIDPYFWIQETAPSATQTDYPSDAYFNAGADSNTKNLFRDITIPPRDAANNPPISPAIHGNLSIFGAAELMAGNAIQIAAGYEAKGIGGAGGGIQLAYNIYSQHFGEIRSQSILRLQWQHLVGWEADCIY